MMQSTSRPRPGGRKRLIGFLLECIGGAIGVLAVTHYAYSLVPVPPNKPHPIHESPGFFAAVFAPGGFFAGAFVVVCARAVFRRGAAWRAEEGQPKPALTPGAALMLRRLLVALGAALALATVAVAVYWWLTPPRTGGTEANWAWIKPGMRLEEVGAILGSPAHVCGWVQAVEGDTTPKPYMASCADEDGTVSMDLNDDETVVSVRFTPAPNRSWLERVRRRLFR